METEMETCKRPKWMTKLLNCSQTGGGISSNQLPAIISELNPDINIDPKLLSRLIKQNDPNPNGSDVLDFDTVTKILFQLILKQPTSSEEDEIAIDSNFNTSLKSPLILNQSGSDCSCSAPGDCRSMKITDFIIFPTI